MDSLNRIINYSLNYIAAGMILYGGIALPSIANGEDISKTHFLRSSLSFYIALGSALILKSRNERQTLVSKVD